MFAAIAFLMFFSIEGLSGDGKFFMFIMATVLLALGEFLIAVIVMSIVAKNVNPRFYALIFAGMSTLIIIGHYVYDFVLGIYRYITGQSTISLFLIFSLMLFIGLLILLIYIIVKLTGCKASKLQL
jgi:hypothetical protein